MSIETSLTGVQPARPRGVWLLTIYAGLFDGLLPLVAGLAILLYGSMDWTVVSPFSLLAGILLDAGVIFSSIRAWQGDDRGRKLLVILVTIHYVLVGFNNALILISGNPTSRDPYVLLPRVFRGVLFPAIYIWYFSGNETLEFYSRHLA